MFFLLLRVEGFLLQVCGVFSVKGFLSFFWSPSPWVSGVGGKVGFSPYFFPCLPLGLSCILCVLFCAFLQALLLHSAYLPIKKKVGDGSHTFKDFIDVLGGT